MKRVNVGYLPTHGGFSAVVLACALGLAGLTSESRAASIVPTEGTQMLYLTTGPGETGAGFSGVDRTGEFGEEGDIATWTYSFEAAGGEALSIDYNILTSEISGGVPDVIEVILNGTSIFQGVVAFTNGTYPVIPAAAWSGEFILGFDGTSYVDGRTGWLNLAAIAAAGTNVIEFFVGDDSDLIVDTALLVDNIRLDGTLLEGFEGQALLAPPSVGVSVGNVFVVGEDQFTVIPEPSSLVLSTLGVAGLLGVGWTGRRRRCA